ncbi:MAG: hypothetical protein PVI06_15480 [Desulfobacterales bacterium]
MNQLSFIAMMDNGGRRLRVDRRKVVVTGYSPERRSGKDRRTGLDRRSVKKMKIKPGRERRKKIHTFDL